MCALATNSPSRRSCGSTSSICSITPAPIRSIISTPRNWRTRRTGLRHSFQSCRAGVGAAHSQHDVLTAAPGLIFPRTRLTIEKTARGVVSTPPSSLAAARDFQRCNQPFFRSKMISRSASRRSTHSTATPIRGRARDWTPQPLNPRTRLATPRSGLPSPTPMTRGRCSFSSPVRRTSASARFGVPMCRFSSPVP